MTEGPQPITGINAANFAVFGKAFMEAQGGRGFVIVKDDKVYVPDTLPGQYPATPREWGAWRAWYRHRKFGGATFNRKGWGTVPAQWPHLFDAGWPEHKSIDAANRWQNTLER